LFCSLNECVRSRVHLHQIIQIKHAQNLTRITYIPKHMNKNGEKGAKKKRLKKG